MTIRDFKHTSGTWSISDTGPKWSINCGSGGAAIKHIAMVSCHALYEGDREENLANAYLIASSPDLLEALEKTFSIMKDDMPVGLRKVCWDAIEKARGGVTNEI